MLRKGLPVIFMGLLLFIPIVGSTQLTKLLAQENVPISEVLGSTSRTRNLTGELNFNPLPGKEATEIEGEILDKILQNSKEKSFIEVEEEIDNEPEILLSSSSFSDPILGLGEFIADRSFSMGVLDNFNRGDGSLGSGWLVREGNCSISGNSAICGGEPGIATFKGLSEKGNMAEVDVTSNGMDPQYAGLILNYESGVDYLLIKVQQAPPYSGEFNKAACYTGSGSFGLGFFPLDSPFTNAHMRVIRAEDSVTIKFTRVDGGTQPDQTYVCTGAPPLKGNIIGISGYGNLATMDNFSIPHGPRVLLLEADYDEEGMSDIKTALEGFGDLSDVDLFDAANGIPSLTYLLSYDVVITWSNYEYYDAVAIGDVLADYVDSGGKVINLVYALGTNSSAMQGRFMIEEYTAINGSDSPYNSACLGSVSSSHPVMSDITDVCDSYRLEDGYLSNSSTAVAYWNDGEIFVAVKNDRSVVSMTGYIGHVHIWTGGQWFQLVHNAIYWLYKGNHILWNQPMISPLLFRSNQDIPDFPSYSSFLTDDFIIMDPLKWKIDSVFVPGGWDSATNLANASEITFMIFENDNWHPAGNPSGGGDPPIWSQTISINDPSLTLFSGRYDATTNIYFDLPTSLVLDHGHYWMVVYPTMYFDPYSQFGRAHSDTNNGFIGQWINPGGGYAMGTDWQPWTVLGEDAYDIAFRIEGEIFYTTYVPLIIN